MTVGELRTHDAGLVAGGVVAGRLDPRGTGPGEGLRGRGVPQAGRGADDLGTVVDRRGLGGLSNGLLRGTAGPSAIGCSGDQPASPWSSCCAGALPGMGGNPPGRAPTVGPCGRAGAGASSSSVGGARVALAGLSWAWKPPAAATGPESMDSCASSSSRPASSELRWLWVLPKRKSKLGSSSSSSPRAAAGAGAPGASPAGVSPAGVYSTGVSLGAVGSATGAGSAGAASGSLISCGVGAGVSTTSPASTGCSSVGAVGAGSRAGWPLESGPGAGSGTTDSCGRPVAASEAAGAPPKTEGTAQPVGWADGGSSTTGSSAAGSSWGASASASAGSDGVGSASVASGWAT